MTAKVRCATCDRPLKTGRYRLCGQGCGAAICRAGHRPPCADVHGGQCPNYEPPADEERDLGLVACGSVVHALRGRTEELRLLLADLDQADLLVVAVAALDALGEAVRTVPGGEGQAAAIALALEHQNLTTILEGNPT